MPFLKALLYILFNLLRELREKREKHIRYRANKKNDCKMTVTVKWPSKFGRSR
jgi:hypothetical protein